MRARTIAVAALFLLVSIADGSPRILTYQGSLLGPGGSAVGNGAYDMRFSIYDVVSGGSPLWTETDTGVQVTGGLFSTTLGDGTAFSSLFFPWHYDLWLEVEIDVDRSGTFESDELFSPRQRLTAAPWAMDADRLNGRDSTAFLSSAMPLTLEASTGSTVLRFTNPCDISNVDDIGMNANAPGGGDMHNVDDIVFAPGGGGSIDLKNGVLFGANIVMANAYQFGTAPMFYRNYSFMEMVPIRDNWSDAILRHYEQGYAFVIEKTLEVDVHAGIAVHLPQGVTIMEMRAVVYDNDASGYIDVQLFRYAGSGSRDVMAAVTTTTPFQSTVVQNLTDSTISYATIENANYTYAICVGFKPDAVGPDKVRFYGVRLAFSVPRVTP